MRLIFELIFANLNKIRRSSIQECFTVSKLEQHKMRSRMNQALQSSPQGGLEESGRVNELVENYVKKNTELYDIETLIPVS